jgi:hypothetical protein
MFFRRYPFEFEIGNSKLEKSRRQGKNGAPTRFQASSFQFQRGYRPKNATVKLQVNKNLQAPGGAWRFLGYSSPKASTNPPDYGMILM